uniref:Uncharacterized protein n=1 Tax=Oryza glumipatula TaxID=40148 RepID=A0A0D9Z3C2_9ORYZ
MVLHESLDGAGVSTVHARANGDPSISTATPATNHLISPPPLHSPPPFAGDNPTFGTTGSLSTAPPWILHLPLSITPPLGLLAPASHRSRLSMKCQSFIGMSNLHFVLFAGDLHPSTYTKYT